MAVVVAAADAIPTPYPPNTVARTNSWPSAAAFFPRVGRAIDWPRTHAGDALFALSMLGARFVPLLTPEILGITVRPGPTVVLLSALSPGCTNPLGLAAFLCGLRDASLMLAL